MLSAPMRDVLIDHLDGAVVKIPDPNYCSGRAAHAAEVKRQTTLALVARGLLRGTRHTRITETGRFELAKVLAEYAEVLIRAAKHVEELKFLSGRPVATVRTEEPALTNA